MRSYREGSGSASVNANALRLHRQATFTAYFPFPSLHVLAISISYDGTIVGLHYDTVVYLTVVVGHACLSCWARDMLHI